MKFFATLFDHKSIKKFVNDAKGALQFVNYGVSVINLKS